MQSTVSTNTGLDPIAEFLKKAKPQTHRALFDILVLGWGLIALGALVFIWKPCIWTYLVSVLWTLPGIAVLVNLSHESQHASLFRNKRWNDWVGAWVCAYPAGSVYGASRAVHLAHHKYLGSKLDPDRHFHFEGDKDTPGEFARFYLWLLFGGQLWTSIIVNGFLRNRGKEKIEQPAPGALVVLPKRSYPEVFNLVPIQLALFMAYWAASGKWWLYFALWMGPIFTLGTLMGYVRGFVDHARLAGDDPERAAGRLITIPNPNFFDRMAFAGMDFHYHAEHHLFPAVPHYYLPRLHKLMQRDERYRNRYVLRSGYYHFLGQYWRQICQGIKTPVRDQAVTELCVPARRKPKVLFIMPKMPPTFWGMEWTGPYAGFKYFNPPLGLMTLAGIIGSEYEPEIRDENVAPVMYNTDADIVAITGTLLAKYHVTSLIEIAKYFHALGKTICIGGPVVNLTPEVVRPYADVLFDGEGELTWPQFLKDYEEGGYKPQYSQIEKVDLAESAVPRIDLINVHDYAIGSIQTTRGCPFTCEFCDIIVMYGRKVRMKSVQQVMKEIALWAEAGQSYILFADDNFIGNRPYVKELLREVIRFNAERRYPLAFYTQASIDMAKDPELLELMREANFFAVFIGVESPRKASLSETLKMQNVHTLDLEQAIHTVQGYGMLVTAGMIVGFDHDDLDIFEEQFQFVQRAGIVFAMMNILEAIPKTPLFDRMKASGRLLEWTDGLATNIVPVNMTHQQLVDGYTRMIQRVYSYDNFLERYKVHLHHVRNHDFSRDRQMPALRNIISVFKTIGFYTLTTDPERIRFLYRMFALTMQEKPSAWRWALRYVCNLIHLRKYAHTKVYVVAAPFGSLNDEVLAC